MTTSADNPMTDTMLTKVAKAMYEVEHDSAKHPFDKQSRYSRHQLFACARAALEALDKPDDALGAVLDRVPGGWGRGAWAEGVNHILSEGRDAGK